MKPRMLFAALLALCVSACGVVYIPSTVQRSADNVRVIPLDFQSVLVANHSQYAPRQIPAAFFQTTGTPAGLEGSRPAVTQARPALSVPPAVRPAPYRIGVGDVLLLATKSSPVTVEELGGLVAAQNSRQGYIVQDDGAIAIPDAGRVNVAGMTLDQAESVVFQKLVEAQMNPSFSLEIADFNSQRVTVAGAVGAPGIVPITLLPLSLDQALSGRGGITIAEPDFATIRIFRDGQRYQIPLNDYLTRPDLQKIILTDGDSVFVETEYSPADAVAGATVAQTTFDIATSTQNEARENFKARMELDAVDRDYVYLTGEVRQPSRFALPFGQEATLADALYSNGGFTSEFANPSQIYVLRGSPDRADFGAITAWHLNARNAANMVLATRFELRPNDVVFIAEQPVTKWNRTLQQIVPSLITSGATLATN